MKILFICFANVARSQIAQAYFKTISQHHCDSAGIAVDDLIAKNNLRSRKLKDVPIQKSIEYIKREFNLDLGEIERQQLVPEMIESADIAIMITEKERWPQYLKEGSRSCFGTSRILLDRLMVLRMTCISRCNKELSNWSPRSDKFSHPEASSRHAAGLENSGFSPFTWRPQHYRAR